MNVEKELQKQLLEERESDERRSSYNSEIAFYDAISNGAQEVLDSIFARIDGEKNDNGRMGCLSKDVVRNMRYHTIIMTALISRFCIEQGLDIAVSYALSDIYIRRLDQAVTADEISTISREIAYDYCKRMREIKKINVVSRHIILAIDYIREHIQDNLSVETIAEALSLNSSYLSKLFKQEMGMTISCYIRNEKISIASNMLRHLDESSLNIANFLGFSSQSHFIQVFKKSTGYTPEEYRKLHYHQSWMNDEESK